MKTALIAVSVAGTCLLGTGVLARQDPAPRPAVPPSISGRVVDATNGQPIASAQVSVRLIGRVSSVPAVQTDVDGRFTIAGFPAGRWNLSAFRAGYLGGGFGMRAPNGSVQEFDLGEGEQATDVVLKLWKAASVSGFVTDGSGRPVGGVAVTVYPVGVIAGRRSIEAGRRILTDNQGYYSVPTLAPVPYIVSAYPGSIEPVTGRSGGDGARQRLDDYPRVFFPDALTAADGRVLDLAPGETRNDIDFSLHPRTTFPVSGMLTGRPPAAAPAAGARVELVRESTAAGVWSSLSTASAPVTAGIFTFPRVPPGRYAAKVVEFPVVRAQPGTIVVSQLTLAGSLGFTREGVGQILPLMPIAKTETWWGAEPVTVIDATVGDLTIGMHKGARLTGTLVFDGTGARPTPEGLLQSAIGVVAPDGQRVPSFQMARLEADSTFLTAGLPPGTYALLPLAGVGLLSGGPPTWPETWTSIRTSIDGQDQPGELIHLGERDLTVTLTLSERPTELSGVVRDAAGTARPDASIYIFRSDRALWTAGAPSREVRPNRRGEYRADLPPGEYLVTASATAPVSWMESAALARLADGATAVRLVRGDKRVQDLVIH
jgi:hypothetical protein